MTAFLVAVMVVLAAYTQIALGMEWRTEAGRIGAGFFPRVIGILGVVLCAVAAVRSLRPPDPPAAGSAGQLSDQPAAQLTAAARPPDAHAQDVQTSEEPAPEGLEPEGRAPDGRAADAQAPQPARHPGLVAAAAGAVALLQVLLIPLGAVVTSALFMFGFLRLLGRGRLLTDVLLSILIPLALYLLLDVWLNAGLPDGVLPMF